MRVLLLSVFLFLHLACWSQVFINTDIAFNPGLIVQINDSLKLETAQAITVEGNLDLNGNAVFDGVFQVSGVFNANGNLAFNSPGSGGTASSEVYLSGGNQQITGDAPSFGKLYIGSQGIKSLQTDVFTQELFLDSGRIHTGSFKLDVFNTDPQSIQFSNGWVSSEFNGQLSRNMQTATVYPFPVGDQQRAFPVVVTPLQNIHSGLRYANNSAGDDGLSLFQVDDDVCRLRNDVYLRLYDFPAVSADVRFSMPYPADGNFNRIANRRSVPFETWQIVSEGNPLELPDFITYSVTPSVDDAALVPARVRPEAPIISGPAESCIFDSELVYSAENPNGYNFVWNMDGGSLNVISDTSVEVQWEALPTGLISVVASDAEGCSSVSVNFPVQVFPLPQAEINVTPPLLAFEGQNYTFFASGASDDSIRFYFDDGTESIFSPNKKSFDAPGQYEVILEVTSAEGCIDRDTALVTIEEGLIFSNEIKPNGDGFNDFWEIPSSGMLVYHLQIINRWGTLIFETQSTKISWDGRDSGGNKVPAGAYFYILDAQSASKNYSNRGTVQIIY
jgi:gliding motility-associated-like protein